MKRILTAILCAGILAVTAVGCSYNDALYKDGNSSSQTSEDSTLSLQHLRLRMINTAMTLTDLLIIL